MTRRMRRIIDMVVKEISEMPDEEFQRKLKEHQEGDIARMLRETGWAERFARECMTDETR